MATRLTVVTIFEMYRNIEPLCCVTRTNSVIGQLYFKNKQVNKVTEKKIRFVVTSGRGLGERELGEGSQKVQTSRYKINKY